MQLWRLHIRPKGGACDPQLSTQFCIERSIVGMGWAVTDASQTTSRSSDWEWYKALAESRYGSGRAWYSVWNFATEMQVGDLVWFRHIDGTYYLAEISGDWEYACEGDHVAADIVNFRPARITRIGVADKVPGAICSSFAPTKTLQRVNVQWMAEFSESLLGREIGSLAGSDLLAFLSPTDLENLVAVYLQVYGWILIPGTRRADTPHYEFVLASKSSGERAIVQVKSGDTPIDAASFAGDGKAFLFAASGAYGKTIPANVEVIGRLALEGFLREHRHLLPAAIAQWMDVLKWK